jgi:hypothetical protein
MGFLNGHGGGHGGGRGHVKLACVVVVKPRGWRMGVVRHPA